VYKPLPECLTIKESDIHGMGIFATRNLYPGIDLGIAHIKLEGFPQGHCRTPLGGFYNHSDDPQLIWKVEDDQLICTAVKDISPGEEICVSYGDGYWLARNIKKVK